MQPSPHTKFLTDPGRHSGPSRCDCRQPDAAIDPDHAVGRAPDVARDARPAPASHGRIPPPQGREPSGCSGNMSSWTGSSIAALSRFGGDSPGSVSPGADSDAAAHFGLADYRAGERAGTGCGIWQGRRLALPVCNHRALSWPRSVTGMPAWGRGSADTLITHSLP